MDDFDDFSEDDDMNTDLNKKQLAALLAGLPVVPPTPTWYGPGRTYPPAAMDQATLASQTAHDKVFHTPKLLERILLQNTVNDLLRALRVNKTWRQTIDTSRQLGIPLFRSAVDTPLLGSKSGKEVRLLVNPLLHCWTAETWEFPNGLRSEPKMNYHLKGGGLCFTLGNFDANAFKFLAGMSHDMFITQPPRCNTTVRMACKAILALSVTTTGAQGITMADLVRNIQNHVKGCYMCGQLVRSGNANWFDLSYDKKSGRTLGLPFKADYGKRDILTALDDLAECSNGAVCSLTSPH